MPKIAKVLDILLLLLGIALVVYGTHLFNGPAAFIVAGSFFVYAGWPRRHRRVE